MAVVFHRLAAMMIEFDFQEAPSLLSRRQEDARIKRQFERSI
jgi:hypothetical protein